MKFKSELMDTFRRMTNPDDTKILLLVSELYKIEEEPAILDEFFKMYKAQPQMKRLLVNTVP